MIVRPLFRYAPTCLATAALFVACVDPAGEDTPYIVTPVTSTTLAGTPGWALTDTLVVEVRDAEGHLVPDVKVHWSLPNGGSLAVQLAEADDRLTGTTDHEGRNYAVWTLGLSEGTQVARAAAGTESQTAFTATATALQARSVTVGADYACAVLTDQRPACWGGNFYGQLGVGDNLPRLSPTALQGLTEVLEVVASNTWTTCARDLSGDVWCWGQNALGEGGSLAQPMQATPVRVPGAEAATDLALGNIFTCAVLTVGGGKCWGTNYKARMGTGQITVGGVAFPNPASVIGGGGFVHFGLRGDRGCAVDVAWEVWCWGNGNGGAFSPYPSDYYNGAIQPVPGYKFWTIALNFFSTCGVGLGGEALCFGANAGLGHPSGPNLTPAPLVVVPGQSFAEITSDGERFLGRTRYGKLFVWGSADCCGFNMLTPAELPLPIRVVDVAAGDYGYCVIGESGALYCDIKADDADGLRAFPATPVP